MLSKSALDFLYLIYIVLKNDIKRNDKYIS